MPRRPELLTLETVVAAWSVPLFDLNHGKCTVVFSDYLVLFCFEKAVATARIPLATNAPSELKARKEKPPAIDRSICSSLRMRVPADFPALRQALTTLLRASENS